MEQRTEEWFQARCGMVTTSRFVDAVDRLRSGELSAKAKAYAMEIVTETLTGQPLEKTTNYAMQWGTDYEEEARQAYELETFNEVKQVGFIKLNDRIGGSPDGLIGDDGMIEIKCPYNQVNHIETYIYKQVPEQYISQVQGGMWINNRKWCDFVSYDPRLKGTGKELVIIKVERDEEYIKELERSLNEFTEYVDSILNSIK